MGTDSQRVVRSTLHCGVVHHHDTFAARDPAYPGDYASPGDSLGINIMGRQRGQLQEGCVWIEKQ
jgi:hypothetical protein